MGFSMLVTIPEAIPCPSCANKVKGLPQSGSPSAGAASFKILNIYLVCCPVNGFFIILGYQYWGFSVSLKELSGGGRILQLLKSVCFE